MVTNKYIILATVLLQSFFAIAQVQVSREPRHKPVLENQYIRLLDVRLPPGDTTLYHIHSTPSVFVYLSNNRTATQVQGGEWVYDSAVAGKAWYRSFTPDSLIHRVLNADDKIFHVNDIEILSGYHDADFRPLSLPVIFESDKAIAYSIKVNEKRTINNRGPLIAELVEGDEVIFFDLYNNTSKKIKAGDYLYIPPKASFYFSSNGKLIMVLFEIK
jgi:hypothetical protein